MRPVPELFRHPVLDNSIPFHTKNQGRFHPEYCIRVSDRVSTDFRKPLHFRRFWMWFVAHAVAHTSAGAPRVVPLQLLYFN
jgi:hypothetical protein